MDKYIDITNIVIGIFTVLGTIITIFLVPLIKTKLSDAQFTLLNKVVKIAVFAAESLFLGNGRGSEKLTYCLNKAEDFCTKHNITFDKTQVRDMIEDAWVQLTGGQSDSIVDDTENDK